MSRRAALCAKRLIQERPERKQRCGYRKHHGCRRRELIGLAGEEVDPRFKVFRRYARRHRFVNRYAQFNPFTLR